MSLPHSHSSPFLIENIQENIDHKSPFDIIISYIKLLMKNLHCIDLIANESSEDLPNYNHSDYYCSYTSYYEELSKCNLDHKSLKASKRLLKAIKLLNDKIALSHCQIKTNDYISPMKKQNKSEHNDNNYKSLSLIHNSNEKDMKRFDIQQLVLDTNFHSKRFEMHLDDIKKHMQKKNWKEMPLEVPTKKKCDYCEKKEEGEDDYQNTSNEAKYSAIKNELARLTKENKALKVELRFLYAQCQFEDKINVIYNKQGINPNPNAIGKKDDEDYHYSLNHLSSSDICIQLNENFKSNTWITLKKFIDKLKENDFDINL